MKNHQRINADSGNTEYYTPPEIIEAARRTLGHFDLDPASSATANERVRAKRIFTKEDDGLNQSWFGNVWMNHPFEKARNHLWISKAVNEYTFRGHGGCSALICITWASTSEKWFQPLLQFPQCFLHGRTNYYTPDGKPKKGATKGSVVTYMGSDVAKFAAEFKHLGTVKIPLGV